jgi:hypothetical protein
MKLTRVINYFTISFVTLGIVLSLIYPSVYVIAAQTPLISVSVPTQIISPSQQFSVYIEIQPNNPMAGAQFNLSFNPALVSAQGVSEGGLLKQEGANTFFTPGQIDNSNGTISGVAGAIIDPGQTVSGSGTLAIINMTAKQSAGKCQLTLSKVILSDASAQEISMTVNDGQVEIQNIAPVSLAPSSAGAGLGQGGNNLGESSAGRPDLFPSPQNLEPSSSNDAAVSLGQSAPIVEEPDSPIPDTNTADVASNPSLTDGPMISPIQNQVVMTGETPIRNSSVGLSLSIKIILGVLFVLGFIGGFIVYRLRWQQRNFG